MAKVPERDANASLNLTQEALEALKNGHTIDAIKLVRESTGVGLAEAKAIVYEIQKSMPDVGFTKAPSATPAPGSGLSPGQVGPGAGPGKWVALIAVAAIAIIAAAVYFT